MIRVYRFRVKNLQGELNRQARAVNFVWNYCNDAQKHAVKWSRRWLTHFDLTYLTKGAAAEIGLLANMVNVICKQYVRARRQHSRRYLRYRGRKSLGWVPFRGQDVRIMGTEFKIAGRKFHVFGWRAIVGVMKDGGSFSQDARGHWYLNICVETADVEPRPPANAVGIDLGLKDLAALSDGSKIENPRHVRQLAGRLGKAQRANKRRLAANIHAKIGNARRDHRHKASRQIVNQFDYIAVGNVNAAGLAKTSMAKSVMDASWSTFRNMLRYKAIARGGWYEEVSERFTTQVCSACGCTTGPKGVADLGIRAWSCADCGTVHDRDHNAAINILLRSGHRALVEGAAV